jgi:glycosyltransferase involved in cell wall biosynthesis
MKIVLTRREYITTLDGVNRFIFNLADGLTELGHDVHVVSYSFRDTNRSMLMPYVKKVFDSEADIRLDTLSKKTESENFPKIVLSWFRKGSKMINDLGADTVIMNGVVPLATGASKIAVNHGVFVGSFPKASHIKKLVYLNIVKHLYRNVDVPVCVGVPLSLELESLMDIDFKVVPLPLKLHLFSANPLEKREPLVLHIGTRPGKNVEISIRSIKKLSQKYGLRVKLCVVGSRNAYCEQLMQKYKNMAPDNLEWAFNIPSSAVRDLLSRAKALILPSKYEALSYVTLEAFASGLPVVGSSALPRQVLKDGYNGFRLSSMNPEDYVEKLAILLNKDDVWREMSESALKSAERYSHIKIAGEYQNIAENAIRK